uniref:DUF3237 domain-containing protein n=1 Tax=Panagrellus redivivus TaxID=6233 RepID=A0A7E4ZQS8_PANRE
MKILLKPDGTCTKVRDPDPDVDLKELTICLDSVADCSTDELYPCTIILYDTYKLRLAQAGQPHQTAVAISKITLKQDLTASVWCQGVQYDGPIGQVMHMSLDGKTTQDFDYEIFLRQY